MMFFVVIEQFLDSDFTNFVVSMDPAHKIPEGGIEKEILRESFDGYLPDNILYRQKEAFSDGVGYSSVDSIKEYAEAVDRPVDHGVICGATLESSEAGVNAYTLSFAAIPKTPEARLYYNLFTKHYSDKKGIYTKYYWMPKWNDHITDPSATTLSKHKRVQ
jgi:asparagine synthase (glutamine-hydrolysing)